jgi:hypothetical protein
MLRRISLRHFRRPLIQNRRAISTLKGLPFKVTRESANELFSGYRRFLEESYSGRKSDALAIFKCDPVKECFMPFHSADIQEVSSSYTGEYGIDRTEYYTDIEYDSTTQTTKLVTKTRTVTDWYNCKGTLSEIDYPLGTLSTQIYAGFVYPRNLVEQVLPTKDITGMNILTEEMLKFGGTKKTVYPHEMNMAYAMEKLSSRIYDLEKTRAHNKIRRKHGADHTRVNSLNVYLNHAKIKLISYYLPSYIYQSDISNLANYRFINGYSGEIYGNKIYSVIKSSLFGAGVGGLLTFGFAAITRPYLLIPELALRIAIGSSISGLLSGTAAKWRNESNQHDFISSMENEKNKNTEYIESDDDRERRKFAADMNKNNEYIKKDRILLPIDKCKLLGIDPTQDVTLQIVKEKYHQKIKQWHPDIYVGSNLLANSMTKQINEAYIELTKILSNA